MKPDDQKWWTREREIKEKAERLHKNGSLSAHTETFWTNFKCFFFALLLGTDWNWSGRSRNRLEKSYAAWVSTSTQESFPRTTVHKAKYRCLLRNSRRLGCIQKSFWSWKLLVWHYFVFPNSSNVRHTFLYWQSSFWIDHVVMAYRRCLWRTFGTDSLPEVLLPVATSWGELYKRSQLKLGIHNQSHQLVSKTFSKYWTVSRDSLKLIKSVRHTCGRMQSLSARKNKAPNRRAPSLTLKEARTMLTYDYDPNRVKRLPLKVGMKCSLKKAPKQWITVEKIEGAEVIVRMPISGKSQIVKIALKDILQTIL